MDINEVLRQISKLETVKAVNAFLEPYMDKPLDEYFQVILAACRLRIDQIEHGKPAVPYQVIEVDK